MRSVPEGNPKTEERVRREIGDIWEEFDELDQMPAL